MGAEALTAESLPAIAVRVVGAGRVRARTGAQPFSSSAIAQAAS